MKNALLANEKKVQREQITLDELSEEILFLLPHCYGVERYKVIQSFPKYGQVTYILRGLEFDIQDDIIYFSDLDDILLENGLALLAFMMNSIKKIYKLENVNDTDDPDYYKLEFKDEFNGFIEIHPLL